MGLPLDPAGDRPAGSAVSEPSLSDVLLLFLRARALLVRCVVAGVILVLGITAVLPARYTVSATFLPQVPQGSLSALAGVAAQFGVGLPGDDATQSPAFYIALLGSDAILGPLADSTYLVREDGGARRESLAERWELANPSDPPAIVRQRIITELGKRLNATANRQTGLVTVSLTDRHPELAQEVVATAVALVNDFNVVSRQSQARSESEFIQGRLDSANIELNGAIGRLEAFLLRNRDFHNSPALQFEHDRLSQEVDTRTNLLASLRQNYEQARIDRVRNTPVITLVDPATVPAIPDRRRWGFHLVLGAMLGLIIGLGAIVVRRWWHLAAEADPAFAGEFRSAVAFLGRPWQALRARSRA